MKSKPKKILKNSAHQQENSNNIRKIVTFADIHFGKLLDSERYYNEELKPLLDKVFELKPDIIAILGDTFDKLVKFNSTHVAYANKFINDLYLYSLKTNCAIILIHGTLTHDMMQLNAYSHLINDNFRIFNTSSTALIKDLNLWIIPEEYENKSTYYKKFINTNLKYDFVFGHGMFDYVGFYTGSSSVKKSYVVWSVDDFKDIVYGKVVFGHIHSKTSKANCEYVGSTGRYNFGEEEPKGIKYYEYDILNKKIVKELFIENKNALKFNTKNANDYSDNQEIMFKELSESLSKSYKLRVIIDTEISVSKFNNLKAFENANPLSFKVHDISKSKSKTFILQNKEASKRREERSKLLTEYENLNFYEVTKKIAKNIYNTEFSTDEINKLVFNENN